MKVYIAGKITGDPNYREKFETAKKSLEAEGNTVMNPAELPDGMRPKDYMQICISMIYAADTVAFLPDWNESKGARIEHDLCTYIGKPTVFPGTQTVRLHGVWICQNSGRTKFKCSVCHAENYEMCYNYCPNCGAKLDRERKDE